MLHMLNTFFQTLLSTVLTYGGACTELKSLADAFCQSAAPTLFLLAPPHRSCLNTTTMCIYSANRSEVCDRSCVTQEKRVLCG